MKTVLSTHPAGSETKLDESMIPAINVVFLLLIFFMIAGSIEASSNDLRLPASITQAELEEVPMHLEVRADGRYLINGESIGDELKAALLDYHTGPDTPLTLHVHRELPASTLDPILRTLRELRVEKILIATKTQP